MNILFLDVDGVLNIMSTTFRSATSGSDVIEPHLMERLEFILERSPDTNIVISSSWIEKHLIKKLKSVRFKYLDRILGRTNRSREHRGDQIKDWLDTHEDVENYIVLEDEISDVCGDRCSAIPTNNVIEIDMNEGMSNANTIDAVHRLNNILDISDGVECYFSQRYLLHYEYFYALGYRPHVLIENPPTEEDLERWDYFIVDNNNMCLNMYKNSEES